jgi:hypothetical protein
MGKKTDDMGPQRLRLKASLISSDGGKTWILLRQYYLCDISTDSLMDVRLDGLELATVRRTEARAAGIENEDAGRKST